MKKRARFLLSIGFLMLLSLALLIFEPFGSRIRKTPNDPLEILNETFNAAYRSAIETGNYGILPFLAYKRRNETFLKYAFPLEGDPNEGLAAGALYLYLITKDPKARGALERYARLMELSIKRYGFLVPLRVLDRDGNLRDGIATSTYERSLDAFIAIELSRLGMIDEGHVVKGIVNYYRFIGFFDGRPFLNEGVEVREGRIRPFTLIVSKGDMPRQHTQILRPLIRASSRGGNDTDVIYEVTRAFPLYVSPLGFIKYRPNDMGTFLEMYSSKYVLNQILARSYLGLPTDVPLMIGLFQSVSGYDGYPLLRRRKGVRGPGRERIDLLPNIHGIRYFADYSFKPFTPQYRSTIAALNALYVPMMLVASKKYVELSQFYIYYIKKIYECSVFDGFLYSMYDERKEERRIINAELYAPTYLVDLLYERVTAGYTRYLVDVPYFNPGFRSYFVPKNDTLVIPYLSTGLIRFNVPIEEVKVYGGEIIYRNFECAYVIGENVTLYAKIGSPANLHLNYDAKGDSDRDGILDMAEIEMGLDPFNRDTDGDGLIDSRDPNPGSADGDVDGVLDQIELMFGSDPKGAHTFGKLTDYVYLYPNLPSRGFLGVINSFADSKGVFRSEGQGWGPGRRARAEEVIQP